MEKEVLLDFRLHLHYSRLNSSRIIIMVVVSSKTICAKCLSDFITTFEIFVRTVSSSGFT